MSSICFIAFYLLYMYFLNVFIENVSINWIVRVMTAATMTMKEFVG